MRRALLKLMLSVLLASSCHPGARAADDMPLVADLSSHLVAITTGFTGASVLLFGATDGPGDIAIVIHGPAKDIAVRRMSRFGPIWVNAESTTLHDVPAYYRMASSGPLENFAAPQLLSRYQIGLRSIRVDSNDKVTARDYDAFRTALIRLKGDQGLYSEQIGAINLMSNRLFRTELYFPADVATGTYMVEVYLFRDGAVAAAEIVPFTISKIGIGADIYDFAHQHGFLYGLVGILLAVSAGYGASLAFRRT